ncbi:hypothetical protein OCHUTO_0209 [Orientia chuto str. Dubai]|uniref:Uncharacterized protein n=1 Tax=Orientia chuto str. Dubai TaxID=1359168 RepID=A0A0F3MR91_9RICK|nr:hypothetical protein [Candidatus Orientia mediorientalis]KJV57104.1 hypothetical protein OCHUTO_0209 [Orientia chuto str. Dubai]
MKDELLLAIGTNFENLTQEKKYKNVLEHWCLSGIEFKMDTT